MSQIKNFVQDTISIKTVDSSAIDGFGRWRTSNPETIFDNKQIFDNAPLFWDDQEVSGSGTGSSHSVNEAATTMSVGNTTAGNRTRQTFMRFNYQPGKSQLVLMTFVLDESGGGTGITRNIGLMDDDNGLFLQDDEGTIKFVRRTKVSGSAADTKVTQSSWNLDKLDGTGSSGVTLDFAKTQILFIDFEWLGVGRVRLGFVIDGIVIYAHEFLNTNVLTDVYMSTPNLPLRYEIDNDGTGAASELKHICCSVISEGGSEELGILRYKSTENTHVDCSSDGTLYAIVGIRLKAAYIGSTVKIQRISLMEDEAGNFFEWILVFNPTVASSFTYSDETNSAVQTATGATANTVTSGTAITGGLGVSKDSNASVLTPIPNALRLGSAIDGTVDEIVLCVKPLAGSSDLDVHGAITWRELS